MAARIAQNHRRGSAYLVVLGAAMIVTCIGITALLVSRVRHHSVSNTSDTIQARYGAQSGIDRALFAIEQDRNWRQTYTNGVWFTDVPVGNGMFTVEAIDPLDSDLFDDDATRTKRNRGGFDPVVLTATGVQGKARHKMQVRIQPQIGPALNCLEVVLASSNDIEFKYSSVLLCNQIIASNADVVAASTSVNADVEAVDNISGSSYNGSVTMGVPPREMPRNGTYLEYYLYNGTYINVDDLPRAGGDPKLEKVVLSPNSNPYGLTNPQGIYVINCKSKNLRIRRCRIVGTILLLAPGRDTRVETMNHWEPAVTNYPALLVDGTIKFLPDSNALSESNEGVNFNPPGTPYQGDEDIDQDDQYPSLIKGIIATTRDINYHPDETTIEGVIVCGHKFRLKDNATLNLKYDSAIKDNPPPGFRHRPVIKTVPGSWKQVVN